MKLTQEYLGIAFEHGKTMKEFYMSMQKENLAQHSAEFEDAESKNEYIALGLEHARRICEPTPKKNIFYLSKNVQNHAETIKFDKIDLDWFKNLPSELGTYITDKKECYRFQIYENERINVIRWFIDESGPSRMMRYESFAILLDIKEIAHYPGQDEEAKKRFVKLLLFVKLSEPEVLVMHPNQKIKKDIGFAGKENKILNETVYDVTLVNTLWNKVVLTTGFKVQGYIRVQWYGKGRSNWKLIWVDSYEKEGSSRTY